jgi:hypothetical protein
VLACIAVQIVVRRRRRRCCRAVFCCAVVYCAVCRQWCNQTHSIYFCFRLNFDDSWHGTIFPHLSGWAKSFRQTCNAIRNDNVATVHPLDSCNGPPGLQRSTPGLLQRPLCAATVHPLDCCNGPPPGLLQRPPWAATVHPHGLLQRPLWAATYIYIYIYITH